MSTADDNRTPGPIELIESARTKYTAALGRLRRGYLELALLSFHGSVEDALRAHGLRLNLPAAREPFPDLLEALTQVTLGPLSLAEAEGVRRMHRLRGRIAHGEQVVVAAETIDAYRRLAARLLPRYGVMVTPPDEEPGATLLAGSAHVEEREATRGRAEVMLRRGPRDARVATVDSGPRRERTVYPDAELARYVGRVRPSRATSELPLARQLNRGPEAMWNGAPVWLLPTLIVLSIFLVGAVISIGLQQRSAAPPMPTAVLAPTAGLPGSLARSPVAVPAPGEEGGAADEAPPTVAVLPPFAPGQTVYVRGDVEVLSVRANPGAAADNVVIFGLGPGTAVEVLSGPVEADGYTWWQVRSPLGEGWCAGQYLEAR
ncbi:MAG: ligand-binding protein SH3 [Oscillochloridaceae bacterium]|nr:ligand-binding protein SH3 [Chloroflexaceae bacterium]MDW8392336.1 ligand-binding protein SH3 [Oscillochloridaceae bacterium]